MKFVKDNLMPLFPIFLKKNLVNFHKSCFMVACNCSIIILHELMHNYFKIVVFIIQ